MKVGDLYEHYKYGVLVRVLNTDCEGHIILEMVYQNLILHQSKVTFEDLFRKLTPLEKELHEA